MISESSNFSCPNRKQSLSSLRLYQTIHGISQNSTSVTSGTHSSKASDWVTEKPLSIIDYISLRLIITTHCQWSPSWFSGYSSCRISPRRSHLAPASIYTHRFLLVFGTALAFRWRSHHWRRLSSIWDFCLVRPWRRLYSSPLRVADSIHGLWRFCHWLSSLPKLFRQRLYNPISKGFWLWSDILR